jgi:hypothetical protein
LGVWVCGCVVCVGYCWLSAVWWAWVYGVLMRGVQAVRTNGYVCEALVAVAGLSGRFLDLSSAAIGNGSDISNFLTSPSLDGGSVPLSCATNAATVLANFLRAIAHNQSVAGHQTQSLLLQSIENGLGGFVRRLLSGAAVGERRTVTAGAISALSVSRTNLGSVSSLRLRIPGNAAAAALEFRLPPSFGSDIFGSTTPVVDLELSQHGVAPASGNRTMVSGLSGLTVALPDSGIQAVQGLSLPVLVTLPLTSPLPASSALISQFECVFWDRGRYNSRGCRVDGVVIQKSAVTAVICACTHLTMFAVSFVGDPLGGGLVPVTPQSTTQAGTVFNLSSTPAQSIVSVAGTVLVSFNATGAFGLITSYASLLQQRATVKGVLTQSISAALATTTGHGDSLAVNIILICWGDQCLSFNRRQDTASASTAVPQMRVDFEVRCATMEVLSSVTSSVVLDVFLLQVARHMEARAASENLGNWSVVASKPKVGRPSPASNTELQRPNIKYNDSSANGGDGSGVKDIFSQSNSNLQLITGMIVGVCAGISIIVCCVLRCVLEYKRRKRLKLAPEEVHKHRRKSLMDNRNLLIANYPELLDVLPCAVPEGNGKSGGTVDYAQEGSGDDLVHSIGQAALERSETPIPSCKDPGSTAFTQDSDLSVHVESLAQSRRRPPSLTFIQSLSNISESEQQGVTPALALETPALVLVPAAEKRRGAEVRLKHARTKLANLQRRLDHFIEEAGRQGPTRTRLPGAVQADDGLHSPLASFSGRQPLKDQLNQSDATFRRSVALESPSSNASPHNHSRFEPVAQNQGQLLLARPSPPDFTQRDALAPLTAQRSRSSRLVPSSPLGQPDVIPQPPDTDPSELRFMRPTASVAARLSQRIQQLPDPGQLSPLGVQVKPDGASTTGCNMPVRPSALPERTRPRVWHITQPVDSAGGRSSPQPPSPQRAAHYAARGEAIELGSIKDPAYLLEDIK